MVFPPVHVILGSMHCPFCQNPDTKVIDTRISDDGHSIRRRRVCKACQGRPVREEDLKLLGQKVEEDLRSRGLAEVTSDEVGKAILKPLRDLDVVAYLRFASVYQNFAGLEDFQSAIDGLRE